MSYWIDQRRGVEVHMDPFAERQDCMLVTVPPFCPGPGVVVPYLGDELATWHECLRVIYHIRQDSCVPLAKGMILVTSAENLRTMYSAEDLLFSRAYGHPDQTERVNALILLAHVLGMIPPDSRWH